MGSASWDERLFGSVYRALAGVWRRDLVKSPDEIAREVLLAPRAPSLRIFASALRGSPVELLEAEGLGGAQGDTLRLPASFGFAPTREENERALVLRTAYSAVASRLGFFWGGDEDLRSLATLLAVPLTWLTLRDELPGVDDALRELSTALATTRPPLRALDPRDRWLERHARGLLGVPLEDSFEVEKDQEDDLTETSRAAIHAALASPPTRPSELAARVVALDRLLPRRAISIRRGKKPAAATWPAVALWGSLYGSLTGSTGATLVAQPGQLGQAGARTERKGRQREGVRRVVLKEAPSDAENPVIHSFEKVHTAEAYQGGDKRADGDDELADHADALDEVELREVVRSTERAASLYRSDLVIEDGGFDVADGADTGGARAFPYDEWDEKARAYKRAFCTVYADIAPEPTDRAEARRRAEATRRRYRRSIEELRGVLEETESARRWRTRQTDGPEIDLDAMVERHAALRSGHAGTEKLYALRKPDHPAVAVLVLLDQSLSTDAWIDGRRVLDVARDALIVLSAALRDVQVETAIASFSSNTRHDCRFATIKHFDEPWSSSDRRVMAVEPSGYTRIGPALRHGAHVLDGWHARRKLMLLVSDGKPSDYDRYEGRYGVADVRQAIREAKPRGITTFALAIDASARFHLPQMFGPGGYAVMPRPEALVGALGRAYREALR